MRDFNGYKMTGLTDDDNKAIMDAINQQIGLKIDELGRVWNSGGQYVADAEEVEPGLGILCN